MKFYAPKYKQLNLGLLRSPLDELDKTNRWVALGDLLLWTELEKEYNSRLDNQKKGAGNKPARMILGAMIIKHKLNLSDAETIEIIRESPYMQYCCGLHEFTDKSIFNPSLFVMIRKRISEEELNKMTVKLLDKQRRLLEEKRKREEEEAKKNDEDPPTPKPEDSNAAFFTDLQGREHKGVLKIDATCADAEMRYPVDVDIIHDGYRKVTDYIMKVCEVFELHKPRTNCKHARQAYLQLVKKAKKKGKMVRDTIGVMLNYLRKDIRILMDLLAKNKTYNESQDLLLQIHLFKERFGYLPATILADKIYLNRSNRDILEDFEIHSYCKPLGRPQKDPPSDEMKSRIVKAIGERNEIECSFGTGKRIYRVNDIRAKLPDTARCWTGMCYFVKNVMKFLKELCLALTEIWRFSSLLSL